MKWRNHFKKFNNKRNNITPGEATKNGHRLKEQVSKTRPENYQNK